MAKRKSESERTVKYYPSWTLKKTDSDRGYSYVKINKRHIDIAGLVDNVVIYVSSYTLTEARQHWKRSQELEYRMVRLFPTWISSKSSRIKKLKSTLMES